MNASHVNLYENQSETGSEPAAARMALMERTIKAVKAEALSSTSIQVKTFRENWDSKAPSNVTLLAYVETKA